MRIQTPPITIPWGVLAHRLRQFDALLWWRPVWFEEELRKAYRYCMRKSEGV